MEKISLIITVKNEEQTLHSLLLSIEVQSQQPNEVIIVDGKSSDNTLLLLKAWRPNFPVKILQKKGNRSIGRNLAIHQSRYEIIAITDAGCVLDKDWLKNITQPFFKKQTEVVAGYYKPKTETTFQKAAAAYMLVMPERINPTNFLPATRSMALRKFIWKKVGGFPEQYSYNEDYVFARALQKMKASMVFQKSAVVEWIPPQTWRSFLQQIYRFAYGDTYSNIFRPKVILIYLRYVIFFLLFWKLPLLGLGIFFAYLIWSIYKNMRYISSIHAIYLLPLMQLSTDSTVMIGSAQGFIQKVL